ncbi:MAG TPA: TIM barrel protein [Actinomycetota bacterium]|nr:TIM barrel protein [Actinomycetota bacterium]
MTELAERVAGAPITWGVCEVPGWGHQMSAERVLSEMRSVGLQATELGPEGFLPRGSERALLDEHGLALVAGFVPAVLHDPSSLERDLAEVDAAAQTIASLGGGVLVLAASSGAHGYEGAERLDAAGWAALGRGIDRVVASAGERGLRVAVHPHHGTMVEGPEDVERLLETSDVGLCLDTGHLMVGAADPLVVAREATDRVIHVHLKDVSAAVAGRVAAGELGYLDAVREGLYRPLGDGDLDVAGVVRSLEESGYGGWYVLEHDEVLDHEPEEGSGPIGNARQSLSFLERAWEEVGAPTKG